MNIELKQFQKDENNDISTVIRELIEMGVLNVSGDFTFEEKIASIESLINFDLDRIRKLQPTLETVLNDALDELDIQPETWQVLALSLTFVYNNESKRLELRPYTPTQRDLTKEGSKRIY